MYCKYCGKEINDKAVMCVHCGRMLSGSFSTGSTQRVYGDKHMSISGFVLSLITLIIPLFCLPGFIVSTVQFSKAKKIGQFNNFALGGLIFSALILLLILSQFIVDIRISMWEVLSDQLFT